MSATIPELSETEEQNYLRLPLLNTRLEWENDLREHSPNVTTK